MAFSSSLAGLNFSGLDGNIRRGIMDEYDSRIYGYIQNNSGKYISQRGFPIAKPTGGAIRLDVDLSDIINKCDNVKKGMKTLRIMLFNTILETSVELAYNIKNQMRVDTGTMAASWGIFDDSYLQNAESWSEIAKRFFHNSPELAYNMSKTSAIFKVSNENENSKNFNPEIIQGSAVAWLAKNELILGNTVNVKNYIQIEYMKMRNKLFKRLTNKINEFVREMELSNWKRIPSVKKLRYQQNRSLLALAERLGVKEQRNFQSEKVLGKEIHRLETEFKSMFGGIL